MHDSAARTVPAPSAAESASDGRGQGEPRRPGWLLLIHQVPPKPDYLRVKVRRRLDRLGAVPLKASVYVLPRADRTLEDFQWLAREITGQGGDASVCEATFVEGVRDESLIAAFRAARNADYEDIARSAREIAVGDVTAGASFGEAGERGSASVLARLSRRLAEVAEIDFFGAPAHTEAETQLRAAEDRLRASRIGSDAVDGRRGGELPRGRTWVTREGVHVDRIASAWLIRRFIDPEARFRFVPSRGYRPATGELRFDMFEAEYTHEDDRCTFETLLARFELEPDAALRAIAEIVHDIDLKDEKYARPETPGIERLVDGIAAAHPADDARLDRGARLLDDLYAALRSAKNAS